MRFAVKRILYRSLAYLDNAYFYVTMLLTGLKLFVLSSDNVFLNVKCFCGSATTAQSVGDIIASNETRVSCCNLVDIYSAAFTTEEVYT